MSRKDEQGRKYGAADWASFYWLLFLSVVILIAATVFWMKRSQTATEEMINDLGEFYLEEIAERNTKSIASELNKKAAQMEMALTVLDHEDLQNEETVREFIDLVQKVNGLDVFALVDENGMVYTADSSFSGISRFSFLSDAVTQTQVHLVKSYGTKAMVILASPVEPDESAGIRIVSCFTGLNIDNIISAEPFQNPDNKTYCWLFDKNGEMLLDVVGEYQGGKNLFEVLAQTAEFADGYSLQAMREDWAGGKEGYTVYTTGNDENTYVFYKPVPGVDLVFTALMQESNINEVVEAGTQKTLVSSAIHLAVVVTSLLGLFSVLVYVAQRARKDQLENEQLKIIGALSNDNSDIFLMEPLNDRASVLKKKGRIIPAEKRRYQSYREGWKTYVDRFVIPEDADRILEAVEPDTLIAAMDGKTEYSLDFKVRFEDGEHFYQSKFVRLEEEKNQFIVGFRNIDEQMCSEMERQQVLQEALAAAQHANRAKTTFLNNMSHDIRTPMNAIIGYTALAASHLDNREQVQDYLSKIQTASCHLMSLINDVLDMSRIESGKVRIEEQTVHLPDLIHDLRTIVQADIHAKQLDFFIDTVDVVNEDVICDRLRVNQILLNLLSNAMKFTKPGGTVSLRIIQKTKPVKGYADYEFRVKDTGIGMSQEFQQHIFEAFTRERSSTVSGIQGTGLGMAITKSIVDIMGGTIEVHSVVNKGTEFVVGLHFQVSGSPVRQETVADLQGLRALVADDDADTCMSIARMLGVIGMRAEWTTAGKEAVLRAQFAVQQGDEFQAYIIDWLMPDMNGIEVVRRIRRIIGGSKPIIILTAYDWTGIEEEAREAGVTAFCSKPIFLSELREILTQPFPAVPSPQNVQKAETDFHGCRLLLVEDNALNQEIAAEILKGVGFEVDIASDGVEAVETMRAAVPGQYKLILMDVQMPHMDGYEATRQIRSLAEPGVANIPIIAVTANAFEEDRQLALEAGMNGHIAKPIEIPKLMEALRGIVPE